MMEICLEDITRCCRCCLAIVGTMKPLFGASLNDMLIKIIDIKITQDDGYPQQMCTQCVLRLSSAYTFYTMVIKSHQILEEILQRAETNDMRSTAGSCDKKNGMETLDRDSNSLEADISMLEKKNSIQDQTPCNHCINSIETINEKPDVPAEEISESEQSEGSKIEDDYQCSQCDHTSNDKDNFEVHLQTHLPGSKNISKADLDAYEQLCNICGARFRWRTSLHKHLRQHRGRYSCQVCSKVFGEASALNAHVVCHSTNQRPYQCTTCGRSFTQQSSLRKHTPIHDGRPQLSCHDCGKNFMHKGSLRRHRENAHSLTECSLCRKTFAGKMLFDRHMKLHKIEMDSIKEESLTDNTVTESINIQAVTVEFLCLLCTQKFQTKESLEVHICVTGEIT